MSEAFPREVDLYRYIAPYWICPDWTVSSAAFKHEEMSCDDSRLCEASQTCQRLDVDRGGGVSRFSAGFAFDQGQRVVAQAELDNAAHVLVIGKRGRSCRKQFATEVDRRGWAHPPLKHMGQPGKTGGDG